MALFYFHMETELLKLQEELVAGAYQLRAFRTFTILEPKQRKICAADFRDRVVHHAICRVLEPIFEKSLIAHSYACRKQKGTHVALRKAQRLTRQYTYYLKCDIHKYFDSVNHHLLKVTVEHHSAHFLREMLPIVESHDQNFKNLINDYPVASIQFFAPTQAQAIDSNVSIIPVRKEQLKERLGDRFRELDTPLFVQWPDGRREAIVFLFEEESDVSKFSIRCTVHYCVDITDLLKTDRIVPVVIFLRTGNYATELNLGTENFTFLQFRYIVCDLGRLNADNFLTSQNIVARLNLPLMSYNPKKKVEVYSHAVEGLIDMEPRHNYRVKYIDYIDAYANLSESELEIYETKFAPKTRNKKTVMGLLQHSHDKGMQQGMQQGKLEEGAAILRRLVKKKFGDVPKEAEERIEKADSDTLLEWSENVLSAETVDDVFH